MNNQKRRSLSLTLLVVISLAALYASIAAAQTGALKRLMREKLEHSQQALAAVVTSDWVSLENHSRALVRATEDPAWTGLRTPEYERYSAAFVRTAEDLVSAALKRNLDDASLVYVDLTMRCVQCHRYIQRARIVR